MNGVTAHGIRSLAAITIANTAMQEELQIGLMEDLELDCHVSK